MTRRGVDLAREVRAAVDQRLAAFFETKKARAASIGPPSAEMAEAICALTMRGGKRLRAVVAVAGQRSVDPRANLARSLEVCAALELLQTYLLIHDDWMDGDAERRGGAAVHAALASRYGDAHLGASVAVLAGDLASAWAWELLEAAPFPPERFPRAVRAFCLMQEEVVFGQQLDLVGYEDVDLMQDLKTGSYTVRGPLALGAILAGAAEPALEGLARFAGPLGIAFQLRDDLLGTFGDAASVGKPVGSDLRAGKRNALVREAERLLAPAVRAPFDAVFGHPDADDAAVARATALLVDCGARGAVEARLDTLVGEAREALRRASLEPAGQAPLEQLLALLVARDH